MLRDGNLGLVAFEIMYCTSCSQLLQGIVGHLSCFLDGSIDSTISANRVSVIRFDFIVGRIYLNTVLGRT